MQNSFFVGAPCLQAPSSTTMGVSWAVSGLAQGAVEIADNPDFSNSRTVRAGGFGLIPIDDQALQVRLEGLKPSTRYWYRTITTPFVEYKVSYYAVVGEPMIGEVHSFTTLGTETRAHFCVISDTHGADEDMDIATKKIHELAPALCIWNGDATNTTEDKAEAVRIFLNPAITHKDFASDLPYAFESGNHDFRGQWIHRKEEVMLPRHPAERTGAQWELKWNFAERLGDLALIGMDTGEDKPDAHPKWHGLANYSPYRKAQAAWLEEALSRPDIAAAKKKVLFCHIPLYAAPEHRDFAHDGTQIDPEDFAMWSRECHDLWAPILERHGVCAVVCAHTHCARIDAATPDRPWTQIVNGGCGPNRAHVGGIRSVIEGRYENGALTFTIHDLDTQEVFLTATI